ncbi:MAG: IS21 family transposase, partial [Myxococcota bacterium]|nr:IS21 family transposase [Myxococcota bacterium]
RLAEAPELEGRALFEDLMERKPERYEPGQLRTFQRHVRRWRAQEGPPKEIFFPQAHRPGEAMQTDFTWATVLGITICGIAFPHMLCHMVLPYSNWEWATVCLSESMAALKRGVQAALFVLGRVPDYHQTDNSTAATHDLRTGKRGFNEEYKQFCGHFGMTPRTIKVGESHQNGDVESQNGALKRRLEQHLLLRGSRDFTSVEEYERFVQDVQRETNGLR